MLCRNGSGEQAVSSCCSVSWKHFARFITSVLPALRWLLFCLLGLSFRCWNILLRCLAVQLPLVLSNHCMTNFLYTNKLVCDFFRVDHALIVQGIYSIVGQNGALNDMLVDVLKPLQSRLRIGPWVNALGILSNLSCLAKVRPCVGLCCCCSIPCMTRAACLSVLAESRLMSVMTTILAIRATIRGRASLLSTLASQEPARKTLNYELASLVAAAAHTGLISVQEGVTDLLDHMQHALCTGDHDNTKLKGNPTAGPASELWPCLIAERFMDPGLPGEQLLGIPVMHCCCKDDCA